jgi:hypothetical protein
MIRDRIIYYKKYLLYKWIIDNIMSFLIEPVDGIIKKI